MAGKASDRKSKAKDGKGGPDMADALAAFTLPISLPCSEVEFPVLLPRKAKANWKEILEESEQRGKEFQEYIQSKQEPVPKPAFLHTETDYIRDEVFIELLPALEETLNKAKIWEALGSQRCFFNGIDWIAQVLWNNNPRFPGRALNPMHLFNMPWVRKYLKDNPRPFYPKSWLWPQDYAATLIQKTVRQYFVQRDEEVQEMRDFWKKLKAEQSQPDLDTNPFLLKRFASMRDFTNNKSEQK